MPELPEVETVRRGIAAHVVGRTVSHVEVGRERTVRRMGREALIHGLSGTTIVAAQRRGKYLLCPLDSGEVLMIHLRMSGRVLIAQTHAPRPPHTHVVAHLAALGTAPPIELRFVDPRTFGEVLVFDPERAATQVPELARLGPDPLVDEFTPEVLARQLRGKRGAFKAALLDQSVVAALATSTPMKSSTEPDCARSESPNGSRSARWSVYTAQSSTCFTRLSPRAAARSMTRSTST